MPSARARVLIVPLAGLLLAGCAEPLTPASLVVESPYAIDLFPARGGTNTIFHFSVTPTPAPSTRVTWEFGDGTAAQGSSVPHRYGFTNAKLRITATLDPDSGQTVRLLRELVLGTGVNTAPTAIASVASDWAIVGETIRLDGSNSTDPDGDRLAFAWSLTRDGAALPSLSGAKPTFVASEAGRYVARLDVDDPKGERAVAQVAFVVTPPVPESEVRKTFNGTLSLGANGLAATDGVDAARHAFSLPYAGRVAIDLSWADAGAGLNDLDLEVVAGGKSVASAKTAGPGNSKEAIAIDLPPGDYEIVVRAVTGARIDYVARLVATLTITPDDLL